MIAHVFVQTVHVVVSVEHMQCEKDAMVMVTVSDGSGMVKRFLDNS